MELVVIPKMVKKCDSGYMQQCSLPGVVECKFRVSA